MKGLLFKAFNRQLPKDILWTSVAVGIIPSMTFWLIGQFWFIDRAIFNIDYMIICFLLIFLGIVPVVVGISLILILDVIFSVAPAYHFSLTSVLDSIWDLSVLEPGYLAGEASKVILVIFLCNALVYLALKKTQNSGVVAVSCIIFSVLVSFIDVKLSANALTNKESHVIDINFAASTINNLRIAATTAEFSPKIQKIKPSERASDALQHTNPEDEDFKTIVLIVIESFGKFINTEVNNFQIEPLLSLKTQSGVVVNYGETEFKGSTVPGELRELCGIELLTVHPDVTILPTKDCLPSIYRERGYETKAIHGFLGTFFSRNRWYPALEFQDIWFASDIDARIDMAERCGIAFNGICDREIWEMIEGLNLRNSGSKEFIYWLTLSAHLPVGNPERSSSNECFSHEKLALNSELCNLVLQHRQLFSDIASSISKGKLNNTRILLVGDHVPPFREKEVRSLFSLRNVPYIDIKISNNH